MKVSIQQILELAREYFSQPDYQEVPVLTAYVDFNPGNPDNQRATPAWEIDLKKEGMRVVRELDETKFKRLETRQKWADTEERLLNHLKHEKRGGRGVIFFSNHVDDFAVDVPIELETKVYYGDPQLKHLLFILDQYKKYLVVLVSGDTVRLVEVFLTSATDEVVATIESEKTRALGRLAATLAHDRRGMEYDRKLVRQVAQGISDLYLSDPAFERIVLGGNVKIAHAISNALSPAAADRVVAVEALPMQIPDRDLGKRVHEIADRVEAEHDLEVVERMVAGFNRGGPFALEKSAVQRALKESRVRTLVLPYPIAAEDFDEVIVDAIVGNADLEFVQGDAAKELQKYGGIGAVLYYA